MEESSMLCIGLQIRIFLLGKNNRLLTKHVGEGGNNHTMLALLPILISKTERLCYKVTLVHCSMFSTGENLKFIMFSRHLLAETIFKN